MAEENVPAPTRTDEQLVPVKARLPIGKSNLLMDLQKIAFTASADVPSIYIQQFYNTLTMDAKSGIYSFKLDELWFTLDADLLRSALGITPKDSAYPFVAPSTGDLMTSLNNLKFVPKGELDEPRQATTIEDEEGGKMKKAPPAEPQTVSEPQVEDDEYNLQRGIQTSLESFQAPVNGVAIREPDSRIIRKLPEVEGKGKGIISDEQDASTGPSTQPQDDTSANVVHDTPSPVDAETGADTEKSNSKMNTEILYVEEEHGQAGSDPGKTPESRPPPERVLMEEDHAGSNLGQSHVVQAGPNPEPMHEDFVAIVYPQVHESLKLTIEEHVHIENPPSSSRTLSSMKNLDDAFTFASSSVSLLSTPIIDLTPPKPISPPVQEPIITATTATTTTLPPPPPPPQQRTTDPDLATRVFALEKICANFEKKNKLQDKTTQALSSRVYVRSPNPKMDTVESSAPKRSTVIHFRLPERRSTRLTPPAPVPIVDKADEMILQDTLQVSLAEHKSREEQEARENVELVKEHLVSVEIEKTVKGSENVIDDSLLLRNDESKILDTRLEPKSDKESLEVEITNDEEVEITNFFIHVNVNEEEEEITDEVSPRIYTDLVSLDTEKLKELMELQGRYTYLFEHLKARFLSRKLFDTLADHLQEVRDQVPVYVVEGLILERQKTKEEMEQMIAKAILQERGNIQDEISSQIQKAIDNQIPSQIDASVRSYISGHILHVHPAQSQTTSVLEQ
ncbi:hypothetical protein Tco_1287483 [Tanacetum coccineum]